MSAWPAVIVTDDTKGKGKKGKGKRSRSKTQPRGGTKAPKGGGKGACLENCIKVDAQSKTVRTDTTNKLWTRRRLAEKNPKVAVKLPLLPQHPEAGADLNFVPVVNA